MTRRTFGEHGVVDNATVRDGWLRIGSPAASFSSGLEHDVLLKDDARPALLTDDIEVHWAVEDVIDATLTTTGFESVSIFLRDPEGSGIDLAGFRGSCADAFKSIVHFEDGEGIPGLVAGEGVPQRVADLTSDRRFWRSRVQELGFHSYICVPIPGTDRTAGCLEVGHRMSSETLLSQSLTVVREAERLGLLLEHRRGHETDSGVEPKLDLCLLGGFEARRGGVVLPAEAFARRRAVTLLKILLTNYGRTVVRDELIELLWPDEQPKDGVQMLKIVVHYLRRGLGENDDAYEKEQFILTEPSGYAFNPASPHRLDAVEFEKRADHGLRLERRGRWREALLALHGAIDIYSGDYLQDEPYSDWCQKRRRQLREKFFDVLQTTARLHRARGDHESAVRCYRRILDLDSCLEEVHRDLMESLYVSGNRTQALRQYETCRMMLKDEFNVEPVMETETLHRSILAGNTR